jgi:hypothetical protein
MQDRISYTLACFLASGGWLSKSVAQLTGTWWCYRQNATTGHV